MLTYINWRRYVRVPIAPQNKSLVENRGYGGRSSVVSRMRFTIIRIQVILDGARGAYHGTNPVRANWTKKSSQAIGSTHGCSARVRNWVITRSG